MVEICGKYILPPNEVAEASCGALNSSQTESASRLAASHREVAAGWAREGRSR